MQPVHGNDRPSQGQWDVLRAFQAWRRGAGGLGAVLKALLSMSRNQRRAYAEETTEMHDAQVRGGMHEAKA